MALIVVERSEKLSVKTAGDVNVGQVKKRGKFKTVFFESTWRRMVVVCAAINLEITSNLSSKVASCGYNRLFNFLEEYIIVKRTLTTALISLRCTGNVRA